jgi:hypothetical protein
VPTPTGDGPAELVVGPATVVVHPRRSVTFEEFRADVAAPAVAVDGYVTGPSRYDPAGPHATFDHHAGISRFATRATCEQVALAVTSGFYDSFRRGGRPAVDVHVNDADPDICLAIWLLAHPERAGERAVREVVAVEGLLDTTAGTVQLPDVATVDELTWVFQPYWDLRAGELATCDGATLVDVLREVDLRITAHLDGRGGTVPRMGDFEVVGRSGSVVAVTETGPLARARLREAGIEVFVAVRPHGTRTGASIGVTSPFIPVDLHRAYALLNELEGCEGADRWGGSDTVGGSPRDAGTGLSATTIAEVVASCLGPRPGSGSAPPEGPDLRDPAGAAAPPAAVAR